MHFEWDQNKNKINFRKHNIDFSDVPIVFKGTMLIDYDDRQDYGEDRWIGMGLMNDIVVVVVFTERGEDTIRIISVRKANQNECKRYYEAIIKN